MHAEVAAVAVRVEETHRTGRARLDGRPPRVAGDAEGAVGCAVIAAILGENLRSSGEEAGQDKSLIIRLAAAVDEQAGVQVAGRAPGQLAGESRTLLGEQLRRHAAGAFGLTLNGRDDAAIAVAQGAVEELRQAIEIAPALTVEEVDAVAVIELQHGIFTLLNGPGQE